MSKNTCQSTTRWKLLSASVLSLATLGAHADAISSASAPSNQELYDIIMQQQRTIDELKERLGETDEKVEAASKAVEAAESRVSTAPSWADKTTVGGYGELHYNNLENDDKGTRKDEVDFHRFVLFFGHEFNDSLRFFSELELEHAIAGDGKVGEIELEQAWLEMDLTDNHRLRAGLDLIPVGIINLTHEPPTFFGVERNPVEKNIIPATWWEAMVGLNGEIAPGWNYDLLGHSGLATPTDGSNAFKIRNGRQKVGEALANDGAVTGRLRYTGLPGLEVGVTGQYQFDITQGDADIGATLVEGHVDLRRGGFGFRALGAGWWLDDGDPLTGPAALDRDTQWGFYVEPSYRFPIGVIPGELGVFARYNRWDNGSGKATPTASEEEQFNAGVNYWPHPNVVVKFDWQEQFGEKDGNDNDGFNLGLGYQF